MVRWKPELRDKDVFRFHLRLTNVRIGWEGNDLLTGGSGNDKLLADDAEDTLEGGGGTITDFTGGGVAVDVKIAVPAIDAIAGGNDNAFVFDRF